MITSCVYATKTMSSSSSQRVLKCTVCGGDHSRLHCLVICSSCSGDKRRCNCQSGPPSQKKRTQKARSAPSQSDEPDPDYEKLYSKLVQRHERVGNAFQSLKTQNEELAAELEGKKSRNRGTEQRYPGTCRPCENQGTGDTRFTEISGRGKNPHFSNAGGDKKFAGF